MREKGFWDSMHKSVDYVGDHIAEYGLSNEIVKATKDAFISQKIGLIMSECGEALEAMRRFEYEANGYGIGVGYRDWETDRKSTRLNSSHSAKSRMPSSA